MRLLNNLRKDIFFLIIIFVIAVIIRLWGIDYGLPFNNFQPDEPKMVLPATHVAVNFANTKNIFNLEQPEYKYPHGVMNIFSFVFIFIYYVTRVVDKVNNISPGIFSTFDNSTFTLFARVVVALFGSFLCILIYFIGKEVKLGRFVSLCWALMVSVNVGLSIDSKYATRNTISIFLAYLSLYFLIKFLKNAKMAYLIVGSFFIGFSIVSSLERVFFVLPAVVVIYYVSNKNLINFIRLGFISFTFFCIGMFLTSPYIFINFDRFLENGLGGQEETQRYGQIGRTALSPLYVFVNNNNVDFDQKVSNSIAGNLSLVVFIVSIFGMFYKILKKRDKYDLIFLSIFISNLLVFSQYTSQMVRWYLVLIPIFLYYFVYVVLIIKWRYKLIATFIFVLGFLFTAFYSFEFSYSKTLEDTRVLANKWINNNLEKDSLIYNTYWSTDGDFENIRVPFYYYEIRHNMKTFVAPNAKMFFCSNPQFQNQYVIVSSYVTNIYHYPESLTYYPQHSRSFIEFYGFIDNNFKLVKVIDGDKLFSNPGPTIKVYKVDIDSLKCVS